MGIGRDYEAVGADTRDDAVLAFIVVDTLISHAVSDGLKLVSNNAALAYDFPQIGFDLGFGDAKSFGNLLVMASGFDVTLNLPRFR